MIVLPLEGFTIVALEQAVAAPFATRQLADLGARVIKVERPGSGDFARAYDHTVHGESSYFVWLNRGKESIELDIKDGGDRVCLDNMIASADVFVQNLAPGATERLGLDAPTLRRSRPDLVHCSINGYGADGPYKNKKAYDLLVQCETGVLSSTGSDAEVAKVGFSVADVAAGMYAYSGVLSSLLRRERTGEGATMEIAMLDALGEWMTQPMYYSVYGNNPTRRTGARHASIAPYGPYRTADDGRVFLSVQNDREWRALCVEVLDRPDLVTDPRFVHNPARVANDAEITRVLEEVLAGLGPDDVVALLDGAGIANARLRTAQEFYEHPQLDARNRWRKIHLGNGMAVDALLPAVSIAGVEPALGDVPTLGAHNSELRAEFGERSATTSVAR